MRTVFVALLLILCSVTAPASAASDRVPHNLVPTLKRAAKDVPETYHDGCHVDQPVVYRHCAYGNHKSPIRIALFGDSHAAQWFPALLKAVEARGWRLDNYTRAACPSVDVLTLRYGAMDTECTTWRADVLASMALHPPTLIVMTNRGDYPVVDETGAPVADYEGAWDAGLASTLAAMPGKTLVLEDTPLPLPIVVPTCLQKHPNNVHKCEGARAAWIHETHNANERATALAAGQLFGTLNHKVCPGDPCRVIAGHVLEYRDGSHLTATFAARLAPQMGALLDTALAPAP